MKYKAMAAFAAVSTAVGLSQPSFSNHHTGGNGEGFELGNFFTRCCGSDTASVGTVHLPQKGFAVELAVSDPSCCTTNTLAQTTVENLNNFPLFRSITFTLSGPGNASADVGTFQLHVDWTDLHGQFHTDNFTVANGGLVRNGNNFALNVNNHFHSIQPGSALDAVDFVLKGNCNSATQVLDLQTVFLDTSLVNYELDHGVIENESSFCSGC